MLKKKMPPFYNYIFCFKKQNLVLNLVSFLIFSNFTYAQVTIFSEDFETATTPQTNLAVTPYLGWANFNITGNNNRWWIFDNSLSLVPNGNYALAISKNSPYTGGNANKPRYNKNRAAENIAYYNTLIDASTYVVVTLDFNWIGGGQGNIDYGNVVYSLDGINWLTFSSSLNYSGQNTTQTVTSLDISEVAGQQFYLGFRWICNASSGSNPSFIVDDIVVKGNTVHTYCEPTTDSPEQYYIDDVSFLGTLQDVDNFNTGYTNGYQDHRTIVPTSIQAQGESINIFVENNLSSRIKAWVDWDRDGVFDDATEEVYDTDPQATIRSTFGFTIPAGATPGDYTLRIRNFIENNAFFGFIWTYDYDACENFDNTTFYDEFGEAEDYKFTVISSCDAIITSVTDGESCGSGTVDLTATATGTPSISEYRWYNAKTGGSLIATTATGNWTTPSITSTTTYYVTAYNGSCESLTRTKIIAKINPVTTITVSPTNSSQRIVCGKDDVLELTASGEIDDVYLIDEDFETGDLGVFNNISLTGNTATGAANWQNESSTFTPSEQVWFPSISSGLNSNFVISNSDVGNVITHKALQSTSTYDTTDFLNLSLSLDMYYSHYTDDNTDPLLDYVAIEVSTDGTSWSAVTPNIVADVGSGTDFETQNYDLSTYINETTLSLRIRYYAEWRDGIAIDNIKLFGDQDITSVDWVLTPSGAVDLYLDAGGVTPYSGGFEETVYVIPNNTQLETTQFDFSVSLSSSNGCGIVSENFTITNKTRIWNGTTSTNWNLASNWYTNEIPTSDSCVIIRDTGSTNDVFLLGPPFPPTPAYAKNVTIEANGVIELESDSSLTVTDWVDIDANGSFILKNNASLIQVTDVISNNNIGNLTMEREVTGLNATDYVYWSSAVESFPVTSISPGTPTGLIFEWIPTVTGNGTGNYGEWQNTTENMVSGKGYIVRGLSGTAIANTSQFLGVPKNGIITKAIERGSYTGADYPGAGGTMATALDDNWNLIGNPYPSAISADDFILANASVITDDINPAINGTVYLWTHQTAPSNANVDPFYGDFVYNYSGNDYIKYNITGSIPAGFNGFIGSGQAFFVLMDDGAVSPSNVAFNNTMRHATYSNNQFYRETSTTNNYSIEKNRIWLDLVNSNDFATSTLIGYIEGATNDEDRLFDGFHVSTNAMHLYSIAEDISYAIQGKALPFNENDSIPLGLEVPVNDVYTIAIHHVDGLFENITQNIFIEDIYTNTIHDLRLAPYTITIDEGVYEDRFILRFTDEALGINDLIKNNDISIIRINDEIKVSSSFETIDTISVYDLSGRLIVNHNHINTMQHSISTANMAKAIYIVKVSLKNKYQKIQKVIN